MNPCKCGYLDDPLKACNKAPICVSSYQSKISGPILDRFDLHIEVGNSQEHYSYDQVLNATEEESSVEVAKRVKAAHAMQAEGGLKLQMRHIKIYDIKINNLL